MFGTKETSNVYLYKKPFFKEVSYGEHHDLIFTDLSEQDREDIDVIHGIILKFAQDYGLVIQNENKLNTAITDEIGSWIFQLTWLNPRALVDPDVLGTLLSSLTMSNDTPINNILDLHTRLGVLFDHRLLNRLVNQVFTSVEIIPYNPPDRKEVKDWKDIHVEYPFIWLIIYIQSVIRTSATPITLRNFVNTK